MKPFAVADSETDPFLYNRMPRPFVWGFYDGERYEEFKDTDEFVRFISDYEGIIYAHNGGRFDWHFLLPYATPNSEIMLINGRIAKMRIGSCELRDSWNILPIPLAAYQKDKIDYAIFEEGERYKPHNWKQITSYLYSDCKYLYELVAAFIDKHGNTLTQAGASMKLYQKMIGQKVPNSDEEYFNYFRPYYYGGRVQTFERGVRTEPFKVYDINSAYPAAMLKKHPFGLEYSVETGPLEYALKHPQAFFHLHGVAKGCFPWREEAGKKLVYPEDRVARDYFVTGWEVAAALETGAISRKTMRVSRIIRHEEVRDFCDYILPLYTERLEAKAQGDVANDILCKLAMNSLYGKFGSDPSNYSRSLIVDSRHIPDLLTEGLYHRDHRYGFGGQPCDDFCIATRGLEPWERRYYNLATAASITGCVRAFLFRSLCQVDGPLYCDTDAIACRDGSALVCSKELGDWKHEGDFVQWAIAGRKLYTFFNEEGVGQDFTFRTLKDREAEGLPGWGKIASKGAILSSAQIMAIASGEKEFVNYFQDAPTFSVNRPPVAVEIGGEKVYSSARFLKREIRMLRD